MEKKVYIIISIILIVIALFLVSGDLFGITGFISKVSSCSEDDGGNSIYVKGTVKFISGENKYEYVDYCDENRRLVEYYCLYDSVKTKRHYCDIDCNNGACTKEAVENCTDSDSGLNYYVKGNTCLDGDCKLDFCTDKGYLSEFYCGEGRASKFYLCPNGCKDGICLSAEAKGEETVEEKISYGSILEMLNKCNTYRFGESDKACNELCEDKKCIFGFVHITVALEKDGGLLSCNETAESLFPASSVKELDTDCVCCQI